MKKKVLALSIVCSLCLITIPEGCGSTAPAGSSAAASAVSSTASSAASSAAAENAKSGIVPVITTNTDNIYDKDTNGFVMECSYDTIRLDEESAKAYPGLSDALKAYSDEALKAQKESVESVKNDPEAAGNIRKSGANYYDKADIKLYRTDEDVFSFYTRSVSFMGGAHPNSAVTFEQYDIKTGKTIALTDVVKSKHDLMEKVKTKLKERYPDVEFNDLDKSMKEYEEEKDVKINWGLTPLGITVYFNAYDLAPYAAGPQSVAFRFAEDKDLFTGKYKESEGGLVLPMSVGGKSVIDLERTGNPLTFKVEGIFDEENEHYNGLTVACNNKTYTLEDNVFISYYAKAILTKDNKNYIYVFTTGYSDIEEVLVFEIKDGDVNYCGSEVVGEPGSYITDETGEAMTQVSDTETLYKIEKYPITDPDDLVLRERVDAMSTYHIKRHYKMDADGLPKPAEEFGEAMESITLTAKADITGKTVDIGKNELKDDVTIKKGDKIRIYRTNGKDTVIFKTTDGGYVGLKYEEEGKLNGKPLEELFENLFFAG